MKAVLFAIWLAAATTAAAQAETFTFTNTNQIEKYVGGPMIGGSLSSVAFNTTVGQTTWATGRTEATSSACAIWSGAPGARFPYSGVCDYSGSDGDSNRIAFDCQPTNSDQSEADCWGSISGLAGPHSGKSGTITFHTWGFHSGGASHSAGAGILPN